MLKKIVSHRKFSQKISLIKYNLKSKEYQFKKDQYDDLDALAKHESVSRLLLIRDFPPLNCGDHQSFIDNLVLVKSKNQVYGSESYNALATIQKDLGNSQVCGLYTFEDDQSKGISENNKKVIVDLQKLMNKL